MFAIVDIAGFQEKAEVGAKLRVSKLDIEEGKTVSFDKVLLLSKDGSEATVGQPMVVGATVEAKVLSHGKGEKIQVRKFKRRKRYNRIICGFRPQFTEIEVTAINAK